MQSHRYEATVRDLAGALLPTLAVVALVLGGLRLASRWEMLPGPAVGWDPESAVLEHQARAAAGGPPADLLVLGDSTCLVGVDAAQLQKELSGGKRVLSLATFIWLGLDVYGRELSEFNRSHPGQVRTVLLLVSPAKLEGLGYAEKTGALWDAARHPQADATEPGDWLGVHLLRRCLLSRLLATPLHGHGAEFYGFGAGEDTYMTEHHGSLAMPGNTGFSPAAGASAHDKPKTTEDKDGALALLPALQNESREFRASLPAGVRLCIGLTPGEASRSPSDIRRKRLDLLRRWNQWLGADVLLTNLPPVLPDLFFASGGHLNPVGQEFFTKALARQLTMVLAAKRPAPGP